MVSSVDGLAGSAAVASAGAAAAKRIAEVVADLDRNPLPLHIILLGKVVADLDQHGDALGVAGLGDRRLIGLGAEFPGVVAAEHDDRDSIRTIGVDL
jgi:hypothetical protein